MDNDIQVLEELYWRLSDGFLSHGTQWAAVGDETDSDELVWG